MKAGLLRDILISYIAVSPFLLAGIEYYLLSSLLATIIVSLFKIRRMERAIGEVAEFSKSIASGEPNKGPLLEEGGKIGELSRNITNMAERLTTRLEGSEEEKQRMELILRNMSDGLILMDIRGRILISNYAVKIFFGIESDIDGKPLIENIRNADLIELIGKVIEGSETISGEIEVTRPKRLYLMTTAVPFHSSFNERGVSGVVLTLHNITRLKHLEEMRKDFVANVSHEIKTPITAIKGFAETLLEGAIDDRENAIRFLQTIKGHSDRLNSLVSDLLTLSRIELGDIKIEKRTVRLDDVVDAVFSTLREKAKEKVLFLKKEIPNDLHEVMADRNRLIQILLNLVDNGIKFTEKGGVTVKVQSGISHLSLRGESEAISKDGIPRSARNDNMVWDSIEFSVEDTGIGIPEKHIHRLGERFYRVDRARSRELGGTGLGLAIVKHLIKAHGWEMQIESAQGKGTKVKIIIPPSIKI